MIHFLIKFFRNSSVLQCNNLTKISIIDDIRGIASLSVCLYHIIYSPEGFFTNKLIRSIFGWGSQGVEIFFIVSAIVIPISLFKANYQYNKFLKFIKKRIIRIEPPYIVAVLLGICYLVVRNYIPSSKDIDLVPSIREVILHIGYLIPFFDDVRWINPVFWTLAIEFQYYLFIALCFPLAVSKSTFNRIIFYSTTLIPTLFINNQHFFPHWGAYFAMGIFYILRIKGVQTKLEFWTVFICACGIVIFTMGFGKLMIGLSTITTIHFFYNYSWKILRYLGKISYSLYLVHNIIGAAFLNFMIKRIDQSYEKWIIVILALAISIISAHFLWYFIERPAQKLSHKWR